MIVAYLIFLLVVAIVLAYLLVIHRWLSGSEKESDVASPQGVRFEERHAVTRPRAVAA